MIKLTIGVLLVLMCSCAQQAPMPDKCPAAPDTTKDWRVGQKDSPKDIEMRPGYGSRKKMDDDVEFRQGYPKKKTEADF